MAACTALRSVGIEVPSRTWSPSSRVTLSSISGNRHHGNHGNMADMASVPELILSANCASPSWGRVTMRAYVTGTRSNWPPEWRVRTPSKNFHKKSAKNIPKRAVVTRKLPKVTKVSAVGVLLMQKNSAIHHVLQGAPAVSLVASRRTEGKEEKGRTCFSILSYTLRYSTFAMKQNCNCCACPLAVLIHIFLSFLRIFP